MESVDPHSPGVRRDLGAAALARRVLVAFVFTFVAARVLVFLIMSRRAPDLFLHVGGTHVHHLNYGIFLLAGTGAYLLFAGPCGGRRSAAAAMYGVGLALTFDEFGMWLHLGGGYWQRASFDAVAVLAALLGLVACAPALGRLRAAHWATAALLLAAVGVFAVLLVESFTHAAKRIGPASASSRSKPSTLGRPRSSSTRSVLSLRRRDNPDPTDSAHATSCPLCRSRAARAPAAAGSSSMINSLAMIPGNPLECGHHGFAVACSAAPGGRSAARRRDRLNTPPVQGRT